MHQPAVSIAIPLHNKAPYIAATLRSALTQTFSDFEIVVIDDGSTDGGAEQLKEIEDARVLVVRQQNAGVGAARTRAMREGRARYVAFLDADDLWHPHHLANLMELARIYPDAALLGNSFVEMRTFNLHFVNGASRVHYRIVEDYFAECAAGRMPLHTSSCMVLRDRALELGGFPAGNYRGEDLALWIRLAADAPVCVSDFVGCYYRRGINSLSYNPSYRNAIDIAIQTLEDLLEGRTDWSEDRRQAVREYRYRLALAHGLDCLRAGESGQARKYLRLAANTHAQRRRLWQAHVLSNLPEPVLTAVFRLADLIKNTRVRTQR
jgi:glycosyltransferase involved in cell wall biosynthesis